MSSISVHTQNFGNLVHWNTDGAQAIILHKRRGWIQETAYSEYTHLGHSIDVLTLVVGAG